MVFAFRICNLGHIQRVYRPTLFVGTMSISLEKDTFFRRVKRIYAAWKDGQTKTGETFPNVDAIYVLQGNGDPISYCKTMSLHIWLLGYNIIDMLMIFTADSIHFMASKKKIEFLRPAKQHQDENAVPRVHLHVRSKDGHDKDTFDKLISALKESNAGKSLGIFVKDDFSDSFVEAWKEAIQDEGFENVDISNAIGSLMSTKEEQEIALLKKASQVTVNVFRKYLREQIEDIIDSDKKVKHLKLANSITRAITDKKYVGDVDTDLLDTCYTPIIQSGGNYSLKFSATSDLNILHFGIIICSFGFRYQSYCSNIIRTILVSPKDSVQKNYEFLIDLHGYLCTVLKAGICLGDVYDRGVQFTREKRPDLVDKLTNTFGFVTGINFRESSLSIKSKITLKACKSQVFNLYVGLADLVDDQSESEESKNYSLFIGDIVLVNEDSPATLLTGAQKKGLKNVSVILKDVTEEDDGGESEEENVLSGPAGKRTTVLDSKLRQDPSSAEDKRKQRQKKLITQLNEQAHQRLAVKSSGKQSAKVQKSNISYKIVDQVPNEAEIRELKIFVDQENESVILPVFGAPLPLHISTIKSCSLSVEGNYTYLRINFCHPGRIVPRGEESQFIHPKATFIKEVTYKSANSKESGDVSAPSSNLYTANRLMKEVQKKFKVKEAEEREQANLVRQDELIISNNNKGNPKLNDLCVKPQMMGGKKMTGRLEAHSNGFRFTRVNGDQVDILYHNVKHAFFQPCDREVKILLHFHLKNAIMIQKKKSLDIQFYIEVGEVDTDLEKKHHTTTDMDDLASEQAEREQRKKLNTVFKSFCEKVESVSKQLIEFDTPLRDLGFQGAPLNTTVLLQPTSACLVNLTEWPPFVLALEDVELVYFERVQFHMRNFDMVFVFKDYSQKVVIINAIPMNMLGHVKEWLNQCDILYTEGIQSLNWPKIMKTILDDPEGFFENGGWSFLNSDNDNEEEGDGDISDEDDEPYEPSIELESGDEESDEDSEYSETSTDEDSDEEGDPDSDESTGKDWSELEEEAKREDLRRMNDNFSDERLNGASKHRSRDADGGKKNHSSSNEKRLEHKKHDHHRHSSSGKSKRR